ncbi:MAG: hypothetical protein PHY92_08535, partial [Alphaproteobacteria bacterium]|nr:hypothetical protein [Alphaproteobacteria bacterium]
ACLWNFIGLWAVVYVVPKPDKAALRRFAAGWCFVFLLGLAAFAGSNRLYPHFKNEGMRVHYPGEAISEAVTKAWQDRFQRPLAYIQRPLTYIIGNTWPAGNIAYYAKPFSYGSRPHVLISADYAINPWVQPEDVWEKGGVIVWGGNVFSTLYIPSYLIARFPGAEIQQPLVLPWQTNAALPPVLIGWAIVPPASEWRDDARFYCRKRQCVQRLFAPF